MYLFIYGVLIQTSWILCLAFRLRLLPVPPLLAHAFSLPPSPPVLPAAPRRALHAGGHAAVQPVQ